MDPQSSLYIPIILVCILSFSFLHSTKGQFWIRGSPRNVGRLVVPLGQGFGEVFDD